MAAGTGLTSIPGTITYTDDQRTGRAENYALDAGASNALTATLTNIDGSAVTLVAGFRLLLKTANTLQAGANTLALNGGATKSIVSVTGKNLNTATAAGILLDLAYDGTNFVIMNPPTPFSWKV